MTNECIPIPWFETDIILCIYHERSCVQQQTVKAPGTTEYIVKSTVYQLAILVTLCSNFLIVTMLFFFIRVKRTDVYRSNTHTITNIQNKLFFINNQSTYTLTPWLHASSICLCGINDFQCAHWANWWRKYTYINRKNECIHGSKWTIPSQCDFRKVQLGECQGKYSNSTQFTECILKYWA